MVRCAAVSNDRGPSGSLVDAGINVRAIRALDREAFDIIRSRSRRPSGRRSVCQPEVAPGHGTPTVQDRVSRQLRPEPPRRAR